MKNLTSFERGELENYSKILDDLDSKHSLHDTHLQIDKSTGGDTNCGVGPPKQYEDIIIKLEGDIRSHIRIEQQMRLHIENV